MTNIKQEPDARQENISPAKPVLPPVQGIAPKSVTVFSLGIVGFLLPVLGLVPSILAVMQSKGARQEIYRTRGRLGGVGLNKAGLILGWLGILNSLTLIGLSLLAMWALENLPSLLGSLIGLPTDQQSSDLGDPSALLSLLDGQDLNSLLSDPDVLGDIERRLLEAGLDPDTLFETPPTGSGEITP